MFWFLRAHAGISRRANGAQVEDDESVESGAKPFGNTDARTHAYTNCCWS